MATSYATLLRGSGLPFNRPRSAVHAIPWTLPTMMARIAPRIPSAADFPYTSTRRSHASAVGLPRVSA